MGGRPGALPACRGARGVGYQSKAEPGLAMLDQARAAGHLAGDWMAGDDAYGMVPTLRDALDAAGWRYVLDVPKTTAVFAALAALPAPAATPRPKLVVDGRPTAAHPWRH